jgi:hypothetical protein
MGADLSARTFGARQTAAPMPAGTRRAAFTKLSKKFVPFKTIEEISIV